MSNNQMARPTSISLELQDENPSIICSTRVFLTNDYKVNKLSDFGFTKRVGTQLATSKSVSP